MYKKRKKVWLRWPLGFWTQRLSLRHCVTMLTKVIISSLIKILFYLRAVMTPVHVAAAAPRLNSKVFKHTFTFSTCTALQCK